MSAVIEGKPQLPPGFCFICELSNDVKYVDTFRDFEGNVREKLDGRKYVCEECIAEFAKKLGFATAKEADLLKQNAVDWANKAQALEDELKKYLDLKDVLSRFGINTKPTPKPKVAKAA